MGAGVADRFVLGLQDRGSEWSSRLPSSPRARTVTRTVKSEFVRLGLLGGATISIAGGHAWHRQRHTWGSMFHGTGWT